MGHEVLWERDLHTEAKHEILRSYIGAWFGVLANQSLRLPAAKRRLLVIDGFAGPGRYKSGEEGSPLIMLDTLLNHPSFGQWKSVHFEFRFFEADLARFEHLSSELERKGQLPDNVAVSVLHGDFESLLPGVLREFEIRRSNVPPTFTFIDPFGYSMNPMNLTGRILDFERSEALIFLPLSQIYRFVDTESPEKALTKLYGGESWKKALDFVGEDRKLALLELFEQRILEREGIAHTTSFELKTLDGNDYRLIFAVGHPKGLWIAKDAMWKADPISGTSFVARTKLTDQEILFSDEEILDLAPLEAELAAKFSTEWFRIEEAEAFVLVDTPYRRPHLTQVLRGAEKARRIQVNRPGPHGFPKGTSIRFQP